MNKDLGKKFCWYTNLKCRFDKIFDSIEDAVSDARKELKDCDVRYINIGVVDTFDKDEMIKQGIEGFLSGLDEYTDDFVFGLNDFSYDYTEKKYDKERITSRLKQAVETIVNEEYDPHIKWRSTAFNAKYDLVENQWSYFEENPNG